MKRDNKKEYGGKPDGFSIVICFGSYAKPAIDCKKDQFQKRICLGYISIIYFSRDYEKWIAGLINYVVLLQKRIKRFEKNKLNEFLNS